ncbi:TPA: hypothetical protein DF272_06610 [Candidatus Falkowbacteria bacterium]|nr:hypothetical protein [Candidatus Falkowbacteria bacterium]
MSLRNYLIIIAICTGMALVAWGCVLFAINPETASIWGFGLFYASLLIALFGLFSLLGFSVRFLWQKHDLWYKQLNAASRQAAILSLLVIFTLTLQGFQVLWWWTMLMLLAMAISVELYFLVRQRGER